METLWFPFGLYIETFFRLKTTKAVREKKKKADSKSRRGKSRPKDESDGQAQRDRQVLEMLQCHPVSRHPREPVTREIFVSIRDSLGYPPGKIVAQVFGNNGAGRIGIIHNAETGAGELCCDRYPMQILHPFENLDLLIYSHRFLSFCLALFKIPPAKNAQNNLQPIRELMKIWWDKDNTQGWPTLQSLKELGAEEWIISLFENHPKSTKKVIRDRPWLPGFQEIVRELSYDEKTTVAILKRAQSFRLSAASLTDGDIVDSVKSDLCQSIFANSGKWATSAAKTPQPNYYGYVFRQMKSRSRRIVAALSGQKIRKDGDDKPDDSGKNKLPYAVARFYLVREELNRLLADRPTMDQLRRAIMALLRAIDRLVAGDKTPFYKMLREEVPKHLQADFAWEPSSEIDREILENMSLQLNPQTGQMASSQNQSLGTTEYNLSGGDNPGNLAEYHETLNNLLKSLPEEERYAVEVRYFGHDNKRDFSPESLQKLVNHALKKMKRQS